MSEKEFREKAQELGFSKEEIEEIIEEAREAKERGLNYDLSICLIEPPIDN